MLNQGRTRARLAPALMLIGIVALMICHHSQAQPPALAPVWRDVDNRQAAGARFLTRLRSADPNHQVVLIACLKENELNLLLNKQVEAAHFRTLVTGLLRELNKDFPKQNLRVVAFRPQVPLLEAAIAELAGNTGAVTYFPTEVPR